jgi:hypothetical protein
MAGEKAPLCASRHGAEIVAPRLAPVRPDPHFRRGDTAATEVQLGDAAMPGPAAATSATLTLLIGDRLGIGTSEREPGLRADGAQSIPCEDNPWLSNRGSRRRPSRQRLALE